MRLQRCRADETTRCISRLVYAETLKPEPNLYLIAIKAFARPAQEGAHLTVTWCHYDAHSRC
eukprot:19550-Heterococcus_DN1.PRE.4